MEKRRKEPRVAIPVYGRGLLSGIPDEFFKRPAIFTQPEPWEIVRESFAGDAKPVFVTTMDHGVVGELAAAATGASAVLGIGGGSAMDMAKYAAWKNALPLALLPTILSVDAAFTKAIAVRKGSRVRYFGEVFPDYLLIDFGILRQSPAILNKSGVGDILSIFSALWDWKEAHQRLGEFYDPEIAAGARDLLDRLFAGADEIRDVTDEGLRLISELYAGEVRLCELVGNSRPEEGSEHYLAYCIEAMTGRHFIHGRLIGLCVRIVGELQGQNIAPINDFLERIDLDCSTEAVGLTDEEMENALSQVRKYVHQETHLLPGIFHF